MRVDAQRNRETSTHTLRIRGKTEDRDGAEEHREGRSRGTNECLDIAAEREGRRGRGQLQKEDLSRQQRQNGAYRTRVRAVAAPEGV